LAFLVFLLVVVVDILMAEASLLALTQMEVLEAAVTVERILSQEV
jgi:hypothetical protein